MSDQRFSFKVMVNGLQEAAGDCSNEERMLSTAWHYALQYAEDGEVSVRFTRNGRRYIPEVFKGVFA